MTIVLLYILGPIIVLLYKTLEYRWNFWDRISGRGYALKGLERFKNTSGYPISWIYNDEKDKNEFNALFKRIKRKTSVGKIKNVLNEGHIPSLLVTGGSPIELNKLPPEWDQKDKFYYTSNHPIMMAFNISRSNKAQRGKMERCCSIGELERWLIDEKKNWDFWLGGVVLTIFTITSVIWRLQILEKI